LHLSLELAGKQFAHEALAALSVSIAPVQAATMSVCEC
jgi:hypothetical protein